jgi:hypothetical protein
LPLPLRDKRLAGDFDVEPHADRALLGEEDNFLRAGDVDLVIVETEGRQRAL